jgi:hypothetical protein
LATVAHGSAKGFEINFQFSEPNALLRKQWGIENLHKLLLQLRLVHEALQVSPLSCLVPVGSSSPSSLLEQPEWSRGNDILKIKSGWVWQFQNILHRKPDKTISGIKKIQQFHLGKARKKVCVRFQFVLFISRKLKQLQRK